MNEVRRSSCTNALYAMLASDYLNTDPRVLDMFGLNGRSSRQRDVRSCLQCGQPKTHNNSFCSAECCKAYKTK